MLMLLTAVMLLLALQPTSGGALDGQCALPTLEWETIEPVDAGMDGDRLAEGEAHITENMPYVQTVIVARHGCIVYERYFNGMTPETRQHGFSVTKSVTGTLIGIAVEDGLIGSVDDSIADYLPLASDAEQRDITINHLLHMLSGLLWNEGGAADIGGMLQFRRDEVEYILSRPLTSLPGTVWSYSTADSHLLSAIVTSAAGESAEAYAREHLFEPLGIEDIEWTADANGINMGGTHLLWRPRDMAKFGLLYLRGGDWDGEQIVSSNWIDFVTDPQLDDPSYYELSYAAHWWHVLVGAYESMFTALGYGGQYVLMSPDLDMVVVVTSDSFAESGAYISGGMARFQEEEVLNYIEDYILAAVEE